MGRRRLTLLAAALVLPSAVPSRAQEGVTIHRGDQAPEWRASPGGASFSPLYGDPGAPGPFAFLMRMPAGWTMEPHTHDTGEYLTVLSGTLYMTFETGGDWVDLPRGSVIAIRSGVPMWAKTGDEETIIAVNGVGPFHTEPVADLSLPSDP